MPVREDERQTRSVSEVKIGNAVAKSILFINDAHHLMRKLSPVYPEKISFCQMPGVLSIPFMSPGFSLLQEQATAALGVGDNR